MSMRVWKDMDKQPEKRNWSKETQRRKVRASPGSTADLFFCALDNSCPSKQETCLCIKKVDKKESGEFLIG